MDRPIGIFDSGLGGLTAFKELSKILPSENIVYFGDTGRVPYGNKSIETINKFAMQDIKFLTSLNVKLIIIACGTVSSVMLNLNKDQNSSLIGVVSPTAKAAYAATKNKKIGIIGTTATIQSSSYKNQLKLIDSSVEIFENDCPLFVPLVENGFTSPDNKILQLTVKYYLESLKRENIDTLILGCTHYPILSRAIQNFMGENVSLIDSGRETAIYAAKVLKEKKLDNKEYGKPSYKFYVSDRIDNFSNAARIFLNQGIENKVEQIDIEKY